MNTVRNALLYAMGCIVSTTSCASIRDRLIISVTPQVDITSAKLDFRIRYEGSRKIVAEASSILGGRLNPIALSADEYPVYDAKEFSACPAPEQTHFFDDPGIGEIDLTPGQEFVQVIDLNENFTNLHEILSKCDLVVHWSYKPYLKGGLYVDRVAGAIVIPSSLKASSVETVEASIKRRDGQ